MVKEEEYWENISNVSELEEKLKKAGTFKRVGDDQHNYSYADIMERIHFLFRSRKEYKFSYSAARYYFDGMDRVLAASNAYYETKTTIKVGNDVFFWERTEVPRDVYLKYELLFAKLDLEIWESDILRLI